MKKTALLLVLAILLSALSASAEGVFPDPDWGALLRERTTMVKEKDFELYVEGGTENAPYFGAKFEPRSGVYIGMTAETSEEFQPLGSYLTYIESFSQSDIYYPANIMIEQDNVISMIGWTVTDLGDVDYDAINQTLDMLNSYQKPMFVRFANEMNCSQLGDDPDLYVEVFRNVADLIHQYPNLAVVWSPSDLGALNKPFEYYYPGDEYVDWIGVSCYTQKYFNNNQDTEYKDSVYFMTGDFSWATNRVKPIVEFMKKHGINKPLMLSEGGVMTSSAFGDSEENIASWTSPRLRNMYWSLIMRYPQIKMINYFNINRPYETEKFDISPYPYASAIFKEAAESGAYIRSLGDSPDFVFSKADNGDTLEAKAGVVPLYTLAYFPQNPDISVTYRVDGSWIHSASQIPYRCNFDVNSVTDGMHKLTIETAGTLRSYTFYKSGQYICFGHEPEILTAPPASDMPEISIYIKNGGLQRLEPDQPPVIVDGRTLVPVRVIFDAMGMYVDWNDETKTVSAYGGNTAIKLTIGSNTLFLQTPNGSDEIELDVPAQIIGERTLVPLRAVAEACSALVEWDDATRTITISDWSL